MKTELAARESIVLQGVAVMMRKIGFVRGVLYLTTSRLIFESHKFYVQTGSTVIDLSSIQGARTRWHMFLLPSGIAVELEDGTIHKFDVFPRSDWLTAIDDARSRYHAA